MKTDMTLFEDYQIRLNKEGSELVTNCKQLKMTVTDGKQRFTDVDTGMDENTTAAKTGGGIAKKARKELENNTGKKVIGKAQKSSNKKMLGKKL